MTLHEALTLCKDHGHKVRPKCWRFGDGHYHDGTRRVAWVERKGTSVNEPTYHPCKFCGGSGRIELTGVYAETLVMLRGQEREVSGAALAKEAGVRGEAMCNRLARLEELGFATSRRFGRQRLYRAKE